MKKITVILSAIALVSLFAVSCGSRDKKDVVTVDTTKVAPKVIDTLKVKAPVVKDSVVVKKEAKVDAKAVKVDAKIVKAEVKVTKTPVKTK